MKKFRFVALVLLLLFLLPTVAFAHSGRTDSNGGHYDHSTGEYHYHHGHPAHQHINGKCPYALRDHADSETNDNSAAAPIVFATVATVGAFIVTSIYWKKRAKRAKMIAERTRMARELSAGLRQLKQERESLRHQLLASELYPIMQLVNIPSRSYVGQDKLPHTTNPGDTYSDAYEFAINPSTGVYHTLQCQHAATARRMNIVEMLNYPYFERYPIRPCRACNPKKPPLVWYYEYLSYLHTFDILGVDESDLIIRRPPLKLNKSQPQQFFYGGRSITLYSADSSLISHIGYDEKRSVLYVRLKTNGKIYSYRNISPQTYDLFTHAESLGSFYNNYIKRPTSKK